MYYKSIVALSWFFYILHVLHFFTDFTYQLSGKPNWVVTCFFDENRYMPDNSLIYHVVEPL